MVTEDSATRARAGEELDACALGVAGAAREQHVAARRRHLPQQRQLVPGRRQRTDQIVRPDPHQVRRIRHNKQNSHDF